MKTVQVFAILFNVILIQAALPEPRWYTARDGSRYLIEKYCQYNWYQARDECERRNGQLVAIDTEEKNNNIKDVMSKNNINFYQLWIGGNDANGYRQDELRPFYWSATGEKFSFTNWAQSEPDFLKYKEHCVYLMTNSLPVYAWKDSSCYATMGYICEEKSWEKIHSKLLADLIKSTENLVRNVNTQERDVDKDYDEDE